MTIRPLTAEDVPAALAAWNAVLVHDRLREEELANLIHDCDCPDPEGVLVAVRDGKVEGLIACAPVVGEVGVVIAFFVRPGQVAADLAAGLFARMEAYLKTAGAHRVRVGEYEGTMLAPGVDLRYRALLECYRRAGYERTHTLDDMVIDLQGWSPTAYQQEAMRRARACGVRLADCSECDPAALRAFATRAADELPAGWFWEDWEHGPTMVVALRDEEIIGYANYWPDPGLVYGRFTESNFGSFGPIGVLSAHRGHGVGTWLLVQSMRRVQQQGRALLWAGWTNTPFYLPNGFRVCRQYAVLSKEA